MSSQTQSRIPVSAVADVEVPRGRECAHHDPDEFQVRCVRCGVVGRYEDRGDAEQKRTAHGLRCAQTAVKPLAHQEPREPEPGDRADLTYVSLRTRNEIEVGGEVVDVYGNVVAFVDERRSRRIEVDLGGRYCRSRSDDGVTRLGELLSLDVRAGSLDAVAAGESAARTDGGREVER